MWSVTQRGESLISISDVLIASSWSFKSSHLMPRFSHSLILFYLQGTVFLIIIACTVITTDIIILQTWNRLLLIFSDKKLGLILPLQYFAVNCRAGVLGGRCWGMRDSLRFAFAQIGNQSSFLHHERLYCMHCQCYKPRFIIQMQGEILLKLCWSLGMKQVSNNHV